MTNNFTTELGQKIQNELLQFTGTEHYYKHPFGIVLTDGAKYLADHARAYWLFDVMASYQPRLTKEHFQHWKIEKTGELSAIVTCDDGNDSEPLVTQEIKFTDYPIHKSEFYLVNDGVNKVAMLPYEY